MMNILQFGLKTGKPCRYFYHLGLALLLMLYLAGSLAFLALISRAR